ncbi:phytanoyl-CoA dioxygenase family protein [Kitasatospora sp. NPDC094011]|uniref:phytanoyl-CoA dioxygenase family protein n=1 Tax=Kitasatospora sp. NPDC094011 TaxID=3364090 RepID=UPI00381C3BF2
MPTVTLPELTEQQARHFRDLGYLRLSNPGLPGDLLDETAELVRTRAARLPAGQPKGYRLYESNRELLHRLVTHPALLGPLTSLLGPNVVLMLNRHNQGAVNRPGAQPQRLHRDILQPTRGLLTTVLFFEESTIDAGCTWIIPGSHRARYVGVPQPAGGGTWLDEHPELGDLADQAVPVPVPAGGILLFDATLFHTVGTDTSGGTRTSAIFGFRSADELDAHPDPDRQVIVAGNHLYRGNDRYGSDRPN